LISFFKVSENPMQGIKKISRFLKTGNS
jgi:hypothetical protein